MKNPSPRRSTRHIDDKFTSGSVPLSLGEKKLEEIYRKRVRDTQKVVSKEIKNSPVRASKRFREISQPSSEPLERPVCKSVIRKSNKKTVAKEGEMKTSLELATKDEMRGRTNKLTEDVNKNPDSPKDVPCKEKEEVVSQ